jgi:hypothetical protein
MKKLFLILTLLFLSVPAFAQETAVAVGEKATPASELNAEVAKMTDAQKAALVENIRNPPAETSTAKKAKEWVEVGEGLGSALAGTAGKLGVEVNKFATTPVGQLATFLIVWHFMGDTVIDLTTDILFPLIFVPLLFHLIKKTFGVFDDKGKFVRYDFKAAANDKGVEQVLLAVYMVALFAIILISALFFAA